MRRRYFLNRGAGLGIGAAAALAGTGWMVSALAQAPGNNDPRRPVVQVWKDPSCGCCVDWMKHLDANGFTTQGFDTGNVGIRRRLGMPDALGLSVPRMPIGSPGMDGPEYGGRQDPYDVLLVLRDGSTRVFASYPRT